MNDAIMLAFVVGMVTIAVPILIVGWLFFRGSPMILAMAMIKHRMIGMVFEKGRLVRMKIGKKPAAGVMRGEEGYYGFENEDAYLLDGRAMMVPIEEGVARSPDVRAAAFADKVLHDGGAPTLEAAIKKDYIALLKNEKFVTRAQELVNSKEAKSMQEAVIITYNEFEGKGLPEVKILGESFNLARFKDYMVTSFSPQAMYAVAQKLTGAEVERVRTGGFKFNAKTAAIVFLIITIGLALAWYLISGGSPAGGGSSSQSMSMIPTLIGGI